MKMFFVGLIKGFKSPEYMSQLKVPNLDLDEELGYSLMVEYLSKMSKTLGLSCNTSKLLEFVL